MTKNFLINSIHFYTAYDGTENLAFI